MKIIKSMIEMQLKMLADTDSGIEAFFINLLGLGAIWLILIIACFVGVLPYCALGITHYFPGVFGIVVATLTGLIILQLIVTASNSLTNYAKSKLDN